MFIKDCKIVAETDLELSFFTDFGESQLQVDFDKQSGSKEVIFLITMQSKFRDYLSKHPGYAFDLVYNND